MEFRRVANFLGTWESQSNDSSKQILDVAMKKADRTAVEDLEKKFETQLGTFIAKLEKNRDDTLTIEHYIERYIPVQIQNMIITNM